MKKKSLYVCPKCYQFYSAPASALRHVCYDCHTELRLVTFGYDRYEALSSAAREKFKQQYIEKHFAPGAPQPVPAFDPMPQSGWVGYMGCCGWCLLILAIISSFITLTIGQYGAAAALIISGAVSVGVLNLFAKLAGDVRHIRNQVDKIDHERTWNQES